MRATAQIKLVDDTLPLPEYKSSGAVAIDLYARETVTIEPGTVIRVPLNVIIVPPEGHWIMIAARGSLHKKGLQMANGVGIGDPDFCGPEDEYKAPLLNFFTEPVIVERGERIAQAIFMPLVTPSIQQVTTLTQPSRGAFGSTGTHI